MTKFLLDSGDPNEYREISTLAKEQGSEIWGATTNPSLIAKKLAGKKVTPQDAFKLQKGIVEEILTIVPGAVSAEVYADTETKAEEMIEQGRDIASWHERVVVKLPTTIEGFKARTVLRRESIPINNTLVFSQEQIFAICLHEKIMRQTYTIKQKSYPPFISPFLGRLDDLGEDGISVLANGLKTQNQYFPKNQTWMLSSSIRNASHMKRTIDLNCDIITSPAKAYREWFGLSDEQKNNLQPLTANLKPVPYWQPPNQLLEIRTIEEFVQVIKTNVLDIHHPLTDKGIEKFTEDWKTILA